MIRALSATQPNTGLRTMRLLYFTFFAGVGVFWTYIAVYYRGIGLSGTQIGLIGTLSTMVAVAAMPMWALLNDRFSRTRLLLMVSTLGAAASALGIARCSTFGNIAAVACSFSAFSCAIIPLLDSTTLGLLGDHPEQYGRQRIWGSIGYTVTTAAVGVVLERLGLHSMFAIYALVMVGLAVLAMWLPERQVRLGAVSLNGVTKMLGQAPWLVFAASLFLLGLAFSGVSNFVSVTVKSMGGSDVLIGVAWTLSAVSELPIMFYSAMLLRRFGATRLLAVALVMYTLRMVLYTIMPAPSWVLGIHLIFGSGFGLYWVSAVNYANEIAPPELRTTSQSLVTSTTSLANVIGASMCGWLFDRLGPPGLYAILAICCLAATIIFGAGRLALRRSHAAHV